MRERWARRRQLDAPRPEPSEQEFSQAVDRVAASLLNVADTVPVGTSLPVKQQSRAIQARWAGEQASEQDLGQHFKTLPLEKALSLLAAMRHNIEVAGKIINDRVNAPEVQRCKTCGKTFDQLLKGGKRDWFLNRPHYDPKDRNIILVDHFCSANCVSLENNKTQGVRGISDRGMLRSDNPKNHEIDLAKGAQ